MAESRELRANGLRILTASHPRVRALRRAGHVAEIHGNKPWDSSYLIMDYLKRHPLPANARVLEIGCGWGLLSVFCAKRFGAHVLATDADANVFPYLDLHAEINQVSVRRERRRFDELTTAMLAEFDLILGADICFWDELGRAVFNLINRARRNGSPTIMVADPRRPPFTELAARCMAKFEGCRLIEKRISRPRKGSGEILIIGA